MRDIWAPRPPAPSLIFARRYFGGCRAHVEEAAAVHRAVEMLIRPEPLSLAPDSSIADVFARTSSIEHVDSLETVELVMQLEEEIGAGIDDTSHEEVMLRVLLGRGASRSTWGAETISSRSIRGIVEERVRLRGDCSCYEGTV